jgi:hypothetical protein
MYYCHRLELQAARLSSTEAELTKLRERCATLQLAEQTAHSKARAERDAHAALQELYSDGATAAEAAALRSAVTKLQQERSGLLREAERCRELADIASEQAQAVGHCRRDQEEELSEVTRLCKDYTLFLKLSVQ